MKYDICESHPVIDSLFEQWRPSLGRDFDAYRHHVYRVFNLAVFYADTSGEDTEKIAVAAAFHDVGIWIENTFDYLGPSVDLAKTFLEELDVEEWIPEVTQMIRDHHKLFPCRGPKSGLAESFRQADRTDVCLFLLPSEIPRHVFKQLLAIFPRRGFHQRIMGISVKWIRTHPLRPFPMVKW